MKWISRNLLPILFAISLTSFSATFLYVLLKKVCFIFLALILSALLFIHIIFIDYQFIMKCEIYNANYHMQAHILILYYITE